MDQALALEILLSGEHVLLSGPAGSGKTHVLNQFIRHSKANGKYVAVTATTGLAATHLNGSTIHSWSGIGIHDSIPGNYFEYLPKGRADTINKTDILIIDEISMLHDYRLDMIDDIVRKVRGEDIPFGGIQLVLCGDFFQLPPISRGDQAPSSFVVKSAVWDELDPVVCYLDEQHRQNDDEFLDILTALRSGDVRRNHAQSLLSRQGIDVGAATQLHTTNADVDSINMHELSKLPTEEHGFSMTTSGKKIYVENLVRSCLANEELILKKGALIMCIKNNPDKKFVNGSLGIVTGFDLSTGYPKIELKNGRKLTIIPETWELRDGDKKRASLTQIPLRLAWAITVHKSQGMTLDAARVDLRKAFVEGMGYVALSRVRSLDTLSLDGISQMALRVSSEALEIDTVLRAKSSKDKLKYEHLRKNSKNRKTFNPEKATKGSWSEKLAAMRVDYPNAYKPWSESEDKQLVALFSSGKKVSIKDMTKKLGRHPGSIRARLKKHFGEDAVVTNQI